MKTITVAMLVTLGVVAIVVTVGAVMIVRKKKSKAEYLIEGVAGMQYGVPYKLTNTPYVRDECKSSSYPKFIQSVTDKEATGLYFDTDDIKKSGTFEFYNQGGNLPSFSRDKGIKYGDLVTMKFNGEWFRQVIVPATVGYASSMVVATNIWRRPYPYPFYALFRIRKYDECVFKNPTCVNDTGKPVLLGDKFWLELVTSGKENNNPLSFPFNGDYDEKRRAYWFEVELPWSAYQKSDCGPYFTSFSLYVFSASPA